MLKVVQKYRDMSLANRIIAATAAFFTAAAMIALPVAAWFSSQRKLAELQSIRTPDLLYISAARAEDVKYFDISSIDVGDSNSTDPAEQLYAFAVAGQYVSNFTLQFAHTTNNQFMYQIYEADLLTHTITVGEGDEAKEIEMPYTTEASAKTAYGLLKDPESHWTTAELDAHFKSDVVAHEVNEQWSNIETELSQRDGLTPGTTVYFIKDTCLKDKNDYNNAKIVDDRLIATNKYHTDNYGTNNVTYDKVNQYAEPLIWQSGSISSVDDPTSWGAKPFIKTFILDVTWDRSKISNNKETDMLYIAAFRGS